MSVNRFTVIVRHFTKTIDYITSCETEAYLNIEFWD
ncbi:hypothetical protein MTYM_00910 [Methylococcales bacterium]|nr:hypothetical protein MTYM_00910 [Methylococcales bacterium]